MKLRLLALALTILVVPTAMADTIVIKADEWCPYNCKPGSDKEGFMIDIAKEVFKEAGHTVVYENMPWDNAIEQCKAGTIDAIVGAGVDDAPDLVYPKEPTAVSAICFLSRKNKDPNLTWKYKDMAGLNDVKVGVIEDYAYCSDDNLNLDKWIESNPKNLIKISGKTAAKDLASRLIRGTLDVVIENEFVVPQTFGKDIKDIELTGCGCLDDLFIAFSPNAGKKAKSEEYAKLLTDGMNKLRKDGRLQTILNKYGIKDWKK